ncbi:MAG: hypothetical protein E6J43_11920 [Chloroflexi bacterium]|nr:MAG: hypothetical protein E6J43_11920 [Chloroflexota bacterium]
MERYGDALFDSGREFEPSEASEDPEALWAENRNGSIFVRLTHVVSERYTRVGLDLVPAPVVNTYTVMLRPGLEVIEVRAPWVHFRDVFTWMTATLGITRSELAYVDLREDVRANALQHRLVAKLKRARHKYDKDHDYDTEEVTPNPSKNSGDLSLSTTYRQELASIPGRGKYFSFGLDGVEGEHLIQVAQTNFTVVFRSIAPEKVVTHVLGAALSTGARTPLG